METSTAVRAYRGLLVLYPRDFRDRYGDDLVQTLADLTRDLGPRSAWRRVALDLIVTAPRYRMETLMEEERTSNAMTVGITVMAAAGITSVLVGLYPGVLLLPLAVILAITQRSKLARSFDAVDGTRLRRKRLRTAAGLVAALPVIYLGSLHILGDSWGTDAVVAFGVWFTVLIAAVSFGITGITTPKSPASA